MLQWKQFPFNSFMDFFFNCWMKFKQQQKNLIYYTIGAEVNTGAACAVMLL